MRFDWPKEPRFWVQVGLTICYIAANIVLYFQYDAIGYSVGQRNLFYAGQALMLLAMWAIFPDEFSKWWGDVNNTHKWTKPLAIVLAVLAIIGIVVIGFGSAIVEAIQKTKIPEWALPTLFFAIVLSVVAWLARNLAKKPEEITTGG